MTTARQRRGNSNGETESSGNGTFMGHEDRYYAGGRWTRGGMAVVTYKHVVLGLVFLKWVLRWNQGWSDAAS